MQAEITARVREKDRFVIPKHEKDSFALRKALELVRKAISEVNTPANLQEMLYILAVAEEICVRVYEMEMPAAIADQATRTPREVVVSFENDSVTAEFLDRLFLEMVGVARYANDSEGILPYHILLAALSDISRRLSEHSQLIVGGGSINLDRRMAEAHWHPNTSSELLAIRDRLYLILEKISGLDIEINTLEVLQTLQTAQYYFVAISEKNGLVVSAIPTWIHETSSFKFSPTNHMQLTHRSNLRTLIQEVVENSSFAGQLGQFEGDELLAQFYKLKEVFERVLQLNPKPQVAD